jgi:hypothetical protein
LIFSKLRACSGIGFLPATDKFHSNQRYPVSNETPDRPHTTANFALFEIKFARFRLKTNP